MVPPDKLKELIHNAVEELPYDKLQEIYDFASYLKSKTKKYVNKDISTITSIVGILEGPADLARNHDEMYD